MTVVVLAKTRMGQNICVGAADLETGEPLRLIPRQAAAYHSWREFEAEIGHVIEIEGERAPNVDPPHVEDFLVDNWRDFLAGRYRVDQTIPNPAEWISDHCEVWDVDVEDIFGGQLEATGTGSRFLPRSADIGQMRSVGFWRLPFAI